MERMRGIFWHLIKCFGHSFAFVRCASLTLACSQANFARRQKTVHRTVFFSPAPVRVFASHSSLNQKKLLLRSFYIGADEGNRTPVISLGSFYSTIELHPQCNLFLIHKINFYKQKIIIFIMFLFINVFSLIAKAYLNLSLQKVRLSHQHIYNNRFRYFVVVHQTISCHLNQISNR